MAPMTRNRAIEDGNVLMDLAATYYAQRASAGLIIAEATQTSEAAQGYFNTPGIHNEKQRAVWKKVTQAVHAAGGKIFLQLWHCGRVWHPDNIQGNVTENFPYARGPSAIAADMEIITPDLKNHRMPQPKAMNEKEIQMITDEFVQAARWAIECGFEGVEIHGANGYIFEQFLNRSANQRTDQYGGSLENRARLLCDTVEAVTQAIGSDRVGLRISPYGTFNDIRDPEPEQIYRYVAERMNDYDLAYLHVIRPVVSGNEDVKVDYADPLPEIRERYKGKIIVAGSIDVELADSLIENGIADAIAFGRWFISNPDLPERLKNGWPLVESDWDTYYTGLPEGYADYPNYREQELEPA